MKMRSTASTTPPLRVVREARGLTLRHVAGAAGIDPGHLSRVERGKGGLSVDALARLTNVLGLRELAQLLEPYRGATPDSAKPAVAGSKASRDVTHDREYHRALPKQQ